MMHFWKSASGWTKAIVTTGGLAALAAFVQPASAVVLNFQSIDTPSLAVFNGQLFMAYAGADSNQRLNYAVSSDGVNFSQVTDTSNRSGGGPAIAAFNSQMFVAFPGISDHRINIASSTDGLHYSNQFVINANWNTPWRPALGAGNGKLWLVWLGFDNGLYFASSPDGRNWAMQKSIQPTQLRRPDGSTGTSFVAFPPTLASPSSSVAPTAAYTVSEVQLNGNPNVLHVHLLPVDQNGGPIVCRTSPGVGGIQAGIGFLPGETLMPWVSANSIALDVNGGSCVTGGITYPSSGSPASGGSFGSTGTAPAAVGFNGHAYVAWTGTDGAKHINIVQAF